MNKNLCKLISLVVLLSFFIFFFIVSCRTAPEETLESETIAPETTSVETTPETASTITTSTDKATNIIAEYTVQSGDTLGQIAKSYYGSDSQPYWKLIYEANKDILTDESLIYPGQVIKIPELPEEMKS